MKNYLIFFFLSTGLISFTGLTAQKNVHPEPSGSAGIKTVPDSASLLMEQFKLNTLAWKDAYNSGDAQNLVPLYTEDARYVSGHVAGLEAIGRDKLIANFQNGISGGGHIDEIDILTMQVSCDLATLLCRYQATNSGVTVNGRNLLVLKKVNGQWLIVLHMTVV
jgi:ketosteroid isomerase-like protein